MFVQKNHPAAAQYYLADRMFTNGGRQTATEIVEPRETTIEFYQQNRSERQKKAQALIFATYIPLFFLADTVSEDSEGAIVLIVCCGIAFFLFGITGWQNEEIKK